MMGNNYQFNEADTIQNLAHHIDIHNYCIEKNTPKINVNLKGVVLGKKFHDFLIFMGIFFTFAVTFASTITKYIYITLHKIFHINDNFLLIIYILVVASFIPIVIYLMEYLKKKNQIKILEDRIQIKKEKYFFSNIFNWRIDDRKRNRVILNMKNLNKNIIYDKKIDFNSEAEAIVFCEILKDKLLKDSL